MRKEYDFSQGTRGKHTSKRIRIVGKKPSHDPPKTAAETQEDEARDLKRPKVSNDSSVKRKL
jgi:hypothetical protein